MFHYSKVWKYGLEAVFLYHFPSTLYPLIFFAQSVDRWTSYDNSQNFNGNHMYFIIQKCGYVDKKLSFYFMFSFFLISFKFFAKSVDRWTNSESSEDLMAIVCVSLFKSVEMWTRSCFSISFYFYLVPFNFFCTKCGQVDQLW